MEELSGIPGSPERASTAGPMPLQPLSQDRVNQQQPPPRCEARNSLVSDKISQFNSLTMQSKQLERKTADAALKRAMLGREEAEAEMRRYRDEARQLRQVVEEGQERERRVGERLETVMENYGRTKETHSHTQALWEKEIRRARKETFKSQSVIVKLQEELKSAKAAVKAGDEALDCEKQRSQAREQEAFQARYSLVGLQEQLDQALERVKVAEQERDAFKTLARTEEDVARIASEGKLPLPTSGAADEDDEFASPRKTSKPRLSSFTLADVRSSAASEEEVDELTRLWQWEKQRAERALEQIDFLEAECHLRCCPCMKHRPRSSTVGSAARKERPEPLEVGDAADLKILSPRAHMTATMTVESKISPARTKPKLAEPRRSTIFVPEEGIFRTVSQEEAEALEAASIHARQASSPEPPTPADPTEPNPPFYARTPSVDPPAFALLSQPRTSLLSLLDAPRAEHAPQPLPADFVVPTAPGPATPEAPATPARAYEVRDEAAAQDEPPHGKPDHTTTPVEEDADDATPPVPGEAETPPDDAGEAAEPHLRPHTSAACFATKTTTTKVPLREETTDPSLAQRLLAAQRTPSRGRDAAAVPSFDATNPALTPTMTREQALAQIRERRGRARSAASGTLTPRKQMVEGAGERRDVSAPVPGQQQQQPQRAPSRTGNTTKLAPRSASRAGAHARAVSRPRS